MTAKFVWDNIVAYSLQIGLLVALAAFVPVLLRLKVPRARLAYWHFLLAACLLLPVFGTRAPKAADGDVRITTTSVVVADPQPAPRPAIPRSAIALWLLTAGAVVRLGWLGAGFLRLRHYRRHSVALEPAPSWGVEADLRISDAVASPVTFGLRKPVVLLPARFPSLNPALQEAILCHEILHVRRRDWVFTLAEEVVRAFFWFHPAIWWLLGEIGLAREQAVDREVIELTRQREEYLDALLAIAGARPQLDLAPAPLFLRRRHLKQRVVSILKEVQMSKARLISALTAGLGIMTLACWFVSSTFPLTAAPQAPDDPGISVDLGGATALHRSPVVYPEAARRAGAEGTVTLELTTDANGTVTDARVLSGPMELRRSAIQSVLQWHLMKGSGSDIRQVRITYQLPHSDGAAAPVPQTILRNVPVLAPTEPDGSTPSRPDPWSGKRLAGITVLGLSDQAKADLISQLPVHEGDTLTRESILRTVRAVHEYDEHLTTSVGTGANGDATLQIRAPGAPARGVIGGVPGGIRGGVVSGGVIGGIVAGVPSAEKDVHMGVGVGIGQGVGTSSDGSAPRQIVIGGNVQQMKLISQTRPMYPPEAKQARIQGVVHLQAVIAADGTVKDITVLDGHPLLVAAAVEAVKQWVYQTTLLNGEPVEVKTQIDVNFTLSQ